MDPFNALNVACAVVQFVGFTSKVLRRGYASYRSVQGAAASDVTIESLATELENICDNLSTPSYTNTDVDSWSEDEKSLQILVGRCKSKAEELLKVLQSLRTQGTGTRRGLDAIRQALMREMKKSKIDRLQKEMDDCQQQVNTLLLSLIRDGQSQLMCKLDDMKRRSTRLEIENGTQLDDMRDYLVHSIEGYEKLTADGIDEILSSIMSLRTACVTMDKTQLILSSIQYPEMHQRQDKIQAAHTGTFDWILRDEKTGFAGWLTSKSGAFWITGKPGSGKSTLMKYIEASKDVRDMLDIWAMQDNKSLVIASFYFWHSGTSLQRSQEGLLRSLLFQILKRCPDLIPEVLTHLWTQSTANLTTDGITWSYRSLSEAFAAFAEVAKNGTSTKFCILVDGLDEYEEEPGDLNCTLEQTMHVDDIKLCVASRPWPEFRKLMAEHPHRSIVIQDYTRTDIGLFVNALLSNDPSFRSLPQAGAHEIVTEIIDKAQGVFLWVFLVVRSLLRGLSKGDDIATLHRRVEQMPADLNSFFDRMLSLIEPVYKQPAAVLLLTVLQTRSLPLIAFRYLTLEIETADAVLHPTGPKLEDNKSEAQDMIRKAEYYISACCRDLLELHYTNDDEPYGWLGTCANFTHRTVGEYLNQKEVQQSLTDHLTLDSSYHPWRFMMQVYVYQAKSIPLDPEKTSQNHLLLDTARRATEYALRYEETTGESSWSLMQELKDIDNHKLFTASKLSREGWVHHLTPRLYFAVVLIRAGLASSIRDMLSDDQCPFGVEDSRELLASLFHNGNRNGPCVNFCNVASVLVEAGLDFNHRPKYSKDRLWTAWEVFLLCCHASSDNYDPRWWSMARHMLHLGANPYATVVADDYEFLFTRRNTPRWLRRANLLGVGECIQPACDSREKAELEAVLDKAERHWRFSPSHLRCIVDCCNPIEPDKIWRSRSIILNISLFLFPIALSLLVWLVTCGQNVQRRQFSISSYMALG